MQGVRFIASGGNHTVAVTDEEVYTWGLNSHGQLGTGTFSSCGLPAEVPDLKGRGVCQVACGAEHTMFLCKDGSVYGCGSAAYGQLPLAEAYNEPPLLPGMEAMSSAAHDVPVPAPLRLSFLDGSRGSGPAEVSQIVAGQHSSAFLTRAAGELPEGPQPRLWERLQATVAAAAEAPAIELEAYVRPIAAAVRGSVATRGGASHFAPCADLALCIGPPLPASQHFNFQALNLIDRHCTAPATLQVERIFGSAAAISAAFGIKDKVRRLGELGGVEHFVLIAADCTCLQ